MSKGVEWALHTCLNLTWVEGDAVIKGRDFSVSQKPAQVLSDLNFAWMSYQQMRRGAITLFSDVVYADLADSTNFVTSKSFSPNVAF